MVNITEAMRLALKFARKGNGSVSPNPLVGAVILHNDEVIAKGYHHNFGDIHAEIDAIQNAGDVPFYECTLVTNLEPCSHRGKQPSCAQKIASLGFKKVVVGMLDPNPIVSGKGIEILKNAGVEVIESVLEEECKWLNRIFSKHITSSMPYVIAKTAQSLNGVISTNSGDSKWISSDVSRHEVHKMRTEFDAVVIGKGTALLDNPELTVRHIRGRNPYRVVADTNLSLTENLKLFSDENHNKSILLCATMNRESDKAKRLLEKGINILFLDTNEFGHVNLRMAMNQLYKNYNIGSVLVEGGSFLLNSFLSESLIDEFRFFIAPRIIPGGKQNFNGKYTIDKVVESHNLRIIDCRQSGCDLYIVAIPAN